MKRILPIFFVLCLLVWYQENAGAILPLFTREIPEKNPLTIGSSILVWQDSDTGDIYMKKDGKTILLIRKSPVPSENPAVSPTPSQENPRSTPSNGQEVPPPEKPSPSPESKGQFAIDRSVTGWVRLGYSKDAGLVGMYFIDNQSIQKNTIGTSPFITLSAKYQLDTSESPATTRLIWTTIRTITNQEKTVPNMIPIDIGGTQWTIKVFSHETGWNIQSVVVHLLFDPTNIRELTLKKEYFTVKDKLIASSQVQEMPTPTTDLEKLPWSFLADDSSGKVLLDYSQEYLSQ